MLKNVLLVDDDDASQIITRRRILLSDFAKNVMCLSNGIQAVEYFEQLLAGKETQVPDFIFLDINMPHINGWQFLELFVERYLPVYPHIRICMQSFLILNEHIKKGVHPCVVAHVEKPISAKHMANLSAHKDLGNYFEKA